ncbi:MAG: translation elongation factor Ts [Rhodovibrionaceae bacterium]
MAEITAGLVKELRDSTGAGMMDCKKALTETGGDLDAAVDWLRKKGLSAAAKKSGRVAAEGLIGVATKGNRGAMVEVNSETDFVARNDSFQDFAGKLTELVTHTGDDLEALKAADFPGTGRSVADELTHQIATIGENMNIRRAVVLEVEPGVVSAYVHNQVSPGLGKIGVLVALQSSGDGEKLSELARQIAMHIAAAQPQSIGTDDLDPQAIEREREVLADQARASGKPEEIIEKMVQGRLRKFYEEVVLLEQTWVIDGESRVAEVLEKAGKELGAEIKVAGFERFNLGEGIEKETSDLASEVAATLGN